MFVVDVDTIVCFFEFAFPLRGECFFNSHIQTSSHYTSLHIHIISHPSHTHTHTHIHTHIQATFVPKHLPGRVRRLPARDFAVQMEWMPLTILFVLLPEMDITNTDPSAREKVRFVFVFVFVFVFFVLFFCLFFLFCFFWSA